MAVSGICSPINVADHSADCANAGSTQPHWTPPHYRHLTEGGVADNLGISGLMQAVGRYRPVVVAMRGVGFRGIRHIAIIIYATLTPGVVRIEIGFAQVPAPALRARLQATPTALRISAEDEELMRDFVHDSLKGGDDKCSQDRSTHNQRHRPAEPGDVRSSSVRQHHQPPHQNCHQLQPPPVGSPQARATPDTVKAMMAQTAISGAFLFFDVIRFSPCHGKMDATLARQALVACR